MWHYLKLWRLLQSLTVIKTFFICYILAVVPVGYDPLLDQAGMTSYLLVINRIL